MQLTGRVLDQQTRQPINKASVYVTSPKGTALGVGTTTDGFGRFLIDNDIAGFPNLLKISSVGYLTMTANITDFFYEDYDTENFLLPRNTVELPPVVVTSSKNQWAWLILPALIVAAQSKKKKVGKIGPGEVTTGILIVGGLVGFNLLHKLLDKLGLTQNPTTTEQQDPGSAWKPAYWNTKCPGRASEYSARGQEFDGYRYTIQNAFGIFSDNFNAIMSAFSNLKNKCEVSYLADVFQSVTGDDLLSFLNDGGGIMPWDGLSNEHLKTITTYVSNLPNS